MNPHIQTMQVKFKYKYKYYRWNTARAVDRNMNTLSEGCCFGVFTLSSLWFWQEDVLYHLALGSGSHDLEVGNSSFTLLLHPVLSSWPNLPPPTHTLPGLQYCWAVACFCPPTVQLLMRSPYWTVLNCEICNKQLQTSQQLLNSKISLTKCLWKIFLVGKSMKHTCASFRRPKRKIPSSWRYVRNSNSRKFGFNSQRMQARFSSARLQHSRTQ